MICRTIVLFIFTSLLLLSAREPDDTVGTGQWIFHSRPGVVSVDTCCDGSGCTYWLTGSACSYESANFAEGPTLPVGCGTIMTAADSTIWLELRFCGSDTTGDILWDSTGTFRRFIDSLEFGFWKINSVRIDAYADDNGRIAVNGDTIDTFFRACNLFQGGIGGLPSALYFKPGTTNVFEFIDNSDSTVSTDITCHNISLIVYRVEVFGCEDLKPPFCILESRFPADGIDTVITHSAGAGTFVHFNIGLDIEDGGAIDCLSGIDSSSVRIVKNGTTLIPDTVKDVSSTGIDWHRAHITKSHLHNLSSGESGTVSMNISTETKDLAGRHFDTTCPWAFSYSIYDDSELEPDGFSSCCCLVGDTLYPVGELLPKSYNLNRNTIVTRNIIDS